MRRHPMTLNSTNQRTTTPMNGPSHYQAAAESLAILANDMAASNIKTATDVAAATLVATAAQAHATLALAAATALRTQHEFYEIADDVEQWAQATGATVLTDADNLVAAESREG